MCREFRGNRLVDLVSKGDVNRDGRVDVVDLALIASLFDSAWRRQLLG